MTGTVVFILRLLLAVLLYGFLAWALITIWRELRAQGQLLSAPRIPSLQITCLDSGPVAPPRIFTTPEVIIGRSANSDYVISDETVSVRHARLSYRHNQWWAEDLNSTNGTYLNDERVSVATVIISGDELRCGQVILRVTLNQPEYNKVTL